MNPQDSSSTESRRESISEAAREAWQTTKEKASEALDTGERYVREFPRASAASIFCMGLLLGLVLGAIGRENDDTFSSRARDLLGDWF
jgi:ElaB/YqjD/DUF883 family membrane-anchored ribosome-binding protein